MKLLKVKASDLKVVEQMKPMRLVLLSAYNYLEFSDLFLYQYYIRIGGITGKKWIQ